MEGLPAYKAGQRPAVRADLETFKISSNENPFPPLPGVLEAVMRSAEHLNRYPDPLSTRLVNALSERFGVPADHIALGTGSVSVCGQIVDSVAGPGDEILYAWRSFEAYPIWSQIAGATSVQVPLTAEEEHDLPAMAAAITPRTRLIFLCSPNNPTGTAIRRDDLYAFLDQVPKDVLVVLDEAYAEFGRDPEVVDGIDVYRHYPNVAVLRTFSKAYGLAALRIGFTIAPAHVAEAVRKTAIPFGVSSIAEEAALESLKHEDELLRRVDALVIERTRIEQALRDSGWHVVPSQANFIWLRLGDDAVAFAAECEEQGLTVRPFAGEGVRITVAETAANDRFIHIASRWGERHADAT
jgi:histidinol-phosphate aminotransferase